MQVNTRKSAKVTKQTVLSANLLRLIYIVQKFSAVFQVSEG